MKKILRIIGITLGVIFILLISLPFLFKSKIEALVKQEINKQVEASVDWSKFSLTFFRGFPDLSVNLHDVSVVGLGQFEGDTLVGLKRFEFRVSPFTALKKEIVVKSILLDRPLINGIILEDGTANYDIVPEGEPGDEMPDTDVEKTEEAKAETAAEAGEEESSAMGVSLKLFAIKDGRISYTDLSSDMEASIDDFDLELKGDFSMNETEMSLMMAVQGITAKSEGVRYMKNGTIEMDVLAAANMKTSTYTLKKNEIRINGLVLGAEGVIQMPEDGSIITDIRFFTKETSFATLLSMVPAIYLQDFESLKTSGSLALEGTLKGTMKDELLPDATLSLQVSDGFFSYPDLPKDVSDVQIKLLVNYKGSNQDETTVNLEKFHLLLGGNPFDISLKVDHPFSDMHVAGMVKGMIDFASLKDIVPMEDLKLDGRLDTDLKWDTKMSYIENEQYEQVDLDGQLIIEDVHVNAPDIPVPVQLKRMAMYFTPKYVNLETLDLLLGSSDLHLDGRLTNFIPYVFDNQTVSGSLTVSSQILDANEFLAESESTSAEETVPEDTTGTQSVGEAPASDTVVVSSALKIPENIDFNLSLDMKKILYDNIVVENLTGKMAVNQGVAKLEDLNLNILEGTVNVKGTVDTRKELTEADVKLKLLVIDITASYNTFVTIEKLAPIAQHCKGKANVEMDLFTQLDGDMNPIYESIDAKGHLYAKNLKVEQPAALEKLSAMLKNEKLKNLELERADIWFAVQDGRVIVEPFDMNFDQSQITASGSHGIDQTMDYLLDMKIAKSDLGSGANELMSSMSALAAGAGIAVPQSDVVKVKAKITGTFKDPKVSTDLSGNLSDTKAAVKTAVKEKVTEEVKKVEEEVREEVSAKADEIIKKAEAEKARLVAQATEQGEKLKKEAKAQGDKLIKDAGSNPIKQIAAKKAADELNWQAKKKSEALILEAEQQGDALIAKAKEEAGRI